MGAFLTDDSAAVRLRRGLLVAMVAGVEYAARVGRRSRFGVVNERSRENLVVVTVGTIRHAATSVRVGADPRGE